MICNNLSVRDNTLCFAGRSTVELIEKYGSPVYLMDEDRIRENCRTYLGAMREAFGENALPLYAGKAACFKRMYEIIGEEGMGADVVSVGEIHTAYLAGFPMKNTYFHSNNKTDADILCAMEHGVGRFVVDNEEELFAIDRIAGERGIRQKVLLRLTPGIDPHTYEAVATGKVDSKFGSAIETGQAEQITRTALSCKSIHLAGFHCHVGSQVFDSEVFLRAGEIMLTFIADMIRHIGSVEELDLGGGYGVRYKESDPFIDIAANIRQVADHLRTVASRLGIDLPAIRMEPGRSIVADAGMTLYTVGTIKRIPGYKNYVSVDGGMTDNPRYALYRSPYTIMIANKAAEPCNFICTVAGRCCESGDLLQENVALPATVSRGDILAVLTTGAYNYAMSSNYNRIPRLPIVMLRKSDTGDGRGIDYLAVRRETPEDVTRNDI
ncbi:MAG: diaminopimelate decarboxylase [Clostridia bacterium]|nr:diaminopimelate decarboxylase [Clostridia bacterium]